MWLAGRSVAPLKLVVLKWQVEHSPAVTCAVPSALSSGRTTVAGDPIQLMPFSWQDEQAVMVTRLCTMEGGAVPLAVLKEKLLKLDEEWQPSQASVAVGTCLGGSVTVILGAVPTSVVPAPCQLMHPLVKPRWFIGGKPVTVTKVVKLVAA